MHTVAVAQVKGNSGDLGTIYSFKASQYVLQKPNIPYYEPILFDVPQAKYQCVKYAELRTGIDISGYKEARFIPANATEPRIGMIVKLKEGDKGHVAVIEDIIDGYLVISEANYENSHYGGYIKQGRQILIEDKRILGYIE